MDVERGSEPVLVGPVVQLSAPKQHTAQPPFRYTLLRFDIDDVEEGERKAVARDVAGWILKQMKERTTLEHNTEGGCVQ